MVALRRHGPRPSRGSTVAVSAYQPAGLPDSARRATSATAQNSREWRRRPLARAGDWFQRVLPGAAQPISSMAFSVAGFLTAIDRAAVQRGRAAGGLRQRAVKLELQDVGQEVAHVGYIGGHVVLGAGIEIGLAARRGRRDALVFQAKLPPRLVVFVRAESRPRRPSTAIGRSSARRAGTRSSRAPCAAAGRYPSRVGRLVEKADLHQVLGRDGERDGIADGLVEAAVGAIAEAGRAGGYKRAGKSCGRARGANHGESIRRLGSMQISMDLIKG